MWYGVFVFGRMSIVTSPPPNAPVPRADVHRFAHEAMAAPFEVFIAGEDREYARSFATTAFAEIDRLEGELSKFVETSDVSQINALRKGGSARVGIAAFECLQRAREAYDLTQGAFDVTVGDLMDCWQDEDHNP